MISLQATTFLFDLRVVRRLLNDTRRELLAASDGERIELAYEHVCKIIERIEDVQDFIQALERSSADVDA